MARWAGGSVLGLFILVTIATSAIADFREEVNSVGGRGVAEASNSETAPDEDSQRSGGIRRVQHHKGGPSSGSKPSEGHNKVTKYHYYPHNQHIYLLPECAIQQVCNAVYVRLNHTQPLCACPSRYKDPCSASLNSDDHHSMELMTDISKKPLTMVKTCELTSEMRECRPPRDWSLLALQNVRTGKSHYLVICRCPEGSILEGPMTHDQPTYASVPGIRVYGMMCVKSSYWKSAETPRQRTARPMRLKRLAMPFYNERSIYSTFQRRQERQTSQDSPFPWASAYQLAQQIQWEDTPR